METNGQHKLKLLLDEKTDHYDKKFDGLEIALDNQIVAITALSSSIKTLAESIMEFKKLWGKAIPINLVFYIVSLMVGGVGAITLIKYYFPTP
jgi:hypothetical protein